ncbi:MAG: potassium-transporting ATPase subunit KdpA [Bacteroidota bacterium]
MTANSVVQVTLYFVALLGLAYPLGIYMAQVYDRKRTLLDPLMGPMERLLYRICRVSQDEEMDWKHNALAMLIFNFAGILALYVLQRVQDLLPLNPQGFGAVTPDSAFNTAVSFATNTNWQGYGGETTMSYLTQMVGLTVQNFVSAGTGMAVLTLFIRGLARHSTRLLGNFWVDLTRSILYVLLPLSVLLSLLLVSQGVVQNFSEFRAVRLVEPARDAKGRTVTEQLLPMGPAASQIAIKQLGTNGGGFFNANSAHPYENPTPLSNLLELLSILLIPAALCLTFGEMVGDRWQGWAILAAMMIIFVVLLGTAMHSEQAGNPALAAWGIDQSANDLQGGGNMEGKEVRFDIANSVLWAAATTAASNGSVNSMHDSYTPIGGFVALFMMQLGEVVFGGVGSGLYGMLVFVIVAVFVAGLLVGRTPEYLGHKIEAYEMKMASLLILFMPITVLVFTAIALLSDAGRVAIFNLGGHGFSEVLYLFTSQGNNNGSAFAGIGANTPFYNAIVIIVGALNFFPALALGPIVEHLMMH